MRVPHGNRGKALEYLINYTNEYYKIKGIALIDQIPTPVKIKRKELGKVVEGWVERKSTVDYRGIAGGKSIAFDAKSTRDDKKFSLSNVGEHQFEYLKQHHLHGGISFLLIEFATRQAFFILKFEDLEKWWNEAKNGGRKSIPFAWFAEHCQRCRMSRGIPFDYLAAVGL